MRFTLASAQITTKKADLVHNLNQIGETAIQASEAGADVILFPEASTSGYFLEGGVLESSLEDHELHEELNRRIQPNLKRPLDVMVGFYERSDGNLYNAVGYFEFGEGKSRLLHVYRKFFLPTYGVFDEERFVSRGKSIGVFQTRFGKVAILVCEDIWHSMLSTLCALNGAGMFYVPSASPGRGFNGEMVQSHDRYRRLMKAVAEEHGVWCANCQLCGFEGGKGLIGGSSLINPFGEIIAESPILEPHLLMCEIDLDLITIARSQSPLLGDLENAWGDLQKIAMQTPLTNK